MIGLIILPLVWASLAFVLGPGRGKWLAIAGLAAQTWFAFDLVRQLKAGGVALGHPVGGWGAPLGIDLAADGLSIAMLLLTQCVALPLAIYASAYYNKRNDAAGAYFWPLTGFLVAGLNALFLSADFFNIYVTLELVGLAAVGLVAAGGGAQQITAALRYLFATLVGSGLYLLGVALLYGAYGTVSIEHVSLLVTPQAPRLVWIGFSLMVVGLMVKTALFPFHYWLPPAHGGSPAPVSALLSALVVKASFYLMLRLWIGPIAPLVAAAPWLAWGPAALGTLAIFWGSWRAIRAVRLKMLIAYSTVAQLGYLFLIFPLLTGSGAIQAGVMQAFAHGLAKAAMFVAAGVFIKATGQDTVAGLAGTVDRLPVTLFAFGLAGVTLMGLPPSAGFLAKWLLIEAAFKQGHWWLVLVVLAGGLLAAVYVFRVLRQAFLLAPANTLDAPTAPIAPLAPVPRILEWTALALALASVLLGLRGVELMQLVSLVQAVGATA